MKHAILGFLIDQPMHGYELKRALSPALPPERRVNDGVLYPLLKRMEADGLISGRVERRDGAPDRRVFHPTEAGRRAFDEWLESTVEEHDEVAYDFMLGHPFLTKCLFFSDLRPAQVADKIASQLETSEAKLADFRRIREGHGRTGRRRLPGCRARPRDRTAAREGPVAEADRERARASPRTQKRKVGAA